MTKSTLQLLRFPFSLFLTPVFVLGLTISAQPFSWKSWAAFFILHLLVYPSSNGYNAYMDRDEGSIGGVEQPLPPTKELFYVSVGMDLLALVFSFIVNPYFFGGIALYIAASRLYSWRKVRWKKHPIGGFLVVVICQGSLITWITSLVTISPAQIFPDTIQFPYWWMPVVASALLLASSYPITQIYQHEQDARDGVTTLSMKLGIMGSFKFSIFMNSMAIPLLLGYAWTTTGWVGCVWMLISFSPAGMYLLNWKRKCAVNPAEANFKNTMKMNLIGSLAALFATLGLLILQHIPIFE